jgi:hypothetical protein
MDGNLEYDYLSAIRAMVSEKNSPWMIGLMPPYDDELYF